MDESAVTYVRIIITLGLILTAVLFAAQTLRTWRQLSWGEKMLGVAIVSLLIYTIDANRAAIAAGLEWKWRLGFLTIGLASFAAYLMEPWAIKDARIRRRAQERSDGDPPD